MRLYTRARLHIAVWEAQEEEAVISSQGHDCPLPSFDERMVTITRPDLEGLLQSVTATLMKTAGLTFGLYSQIAFLPGPEGGVHRTNPWILLL